MTNTIYFHTAIRDDVSTSTSCDGTFDEDDQDEPTQSGCFGCTKPQIQLVKEIYNSTPSVPAAFQSNSTQVVEQKDTNNRRELFYATPQGVSSKLKVFDFNQLRDATRDFHVDRVLGNGGFGSVYQGWIDESMLIDTTPGRDVAIAVKRLNLQGSEGYREWLTEAQYLGKLYHPNIVNLLGFSFEDDERLLVYEFMPRGSLDDHLSSRGSHCLLSWSIRMKIALEAAKALAFLHSKKAIIHCDFTSSNILLNSTYSAKLSDFGFAMDGCNDDVISNGPLLNTPYVAPEYFMTGLPHAKCDVFSFGIVLLELLSGRRAMDKHRARGEQDLAKWAIPYLNNKRKIIHILDPCLEGQYSEDGVYKAAKLALRCVSTNPSLRPTMEMVVTTLEKFQWLSSTYLQV